MPQTYTLYKADNQAKKYKVYVVSKTGNIKKIQLTLIDPLIAYTYNRIYPYFMLIIIIFILTFILVIIILVILLKKIIY